MEIKTYKLDAAITELQEYDHAAKRGAYMEIVMWNNGEGFDVNLHSHTDQSFSLMWGKFKALKKLIKELDL